ncbi:MAG: IS5 family transposase [Verrucomicrobia bacterium]|nr:IS5 family transposase [Verrucomicrobiota bacterium]
MNNHAKRDWRKYNQNLINRGSITFWFDKECLDSWITKDGRKGRPSFSKAVIRLGLIIKTVYRLPLRALQGFMKSILNLMGTNLDSPHYTLFCKRAKEATDALPALSNTRPIEIAVDSSGLKIMGEGEWKVKIHGADKRRSWVKIHIGVDTRTQDLIALEVTDEKTGDATVLPRIIERSAKSIKRVLADGAYDSANCRKNLNEKGIKECIPPRKNGKIREDSGMEERNFALEIAALFGGGKEGVNLWKKVTGYHMRSLVETAFSRLKRLFGERLNNRKFENLMVETTFRCHVLNRMNRA